MDDDEREAALTTIRDRIDADIREYVTLLYAEEFVGDPPYVQGWVIGYEWTNVEFERTNRGGLNSITPAGQMLSLSGGLGAFIKKRYL